MAKNVDVVLTVTDFLLIILFSLSTAALGHFFQYCQEPREVFAKWGLWLTWAWLMSTRTQYGFGIKAHYRPRKWWAHLLKPLGLCVYCNSTWINIALFLLLMRQNALLLPLSIGLNYVWVKLLDKL